MNDRTIQILFLAILLIISMASLCLGAAPPGPPSTPLTPPGSLGGAIYAAVIAGVAVVGFWKMKK